MPGMSRESYEAVKAQIEHERLMEFAVENFRFGDSSSLGVSWMKLLHLAGRKNFLVPRCLPSGFL